MDVARLKYHIEKNQKTLPETADLLGISTTALWRKLKGVTEFKRNEIQTLIKTLNIDAVEAGKVFFDD